MIILTCDRCERHFTEGKIDDDLEIQEFLKIDFIGGYASVFGDGARVKLDICQRCLKSLLGHLVPADPRDD